ncbi:ankyrin repeat domain-containing protein 17 [Biomphalaria glabrata]
MNLIRAGAEIDGTAVEQDLGEFFGELLKLNPQLKLQNKDGDTALILAAKKYAQKYGIVRNSDILEELT